MRAGRRCRPGLLRPGSEGLLALRYSSGSRSRSVGLHVHRLRRELGREPAASLTTERGVGFRLRTVGATGDEPGQEDVRGGTAEDEAR